MHTATTLIVRVATRPIESLECVSHRAAAEAAAAWLDEAQAVEAEAEILSAALHEAAGATAPPERAAARIALLGVRRAIHQGREVEPAALDAAGALLAPELRGRIDAHRARRNQAESERESLASRYEASRTLEQDGILAALQDPLVTMGLRLASGALLARAAKLAATSRWEQRERHAASKVLAYLGRFATKTSPNGVFCATAIGCLGEGPAALQGSNRIARLDLALHVGEARKTTDLLGASPEGEAYVRPRANPTLREEGDSWTLWQPATARRMDENEVLLRVRDHPVLRMYLDEADGTASATEVMAAVSRRAGQDTSSFYRKLIERSVLIGEVEIPWSERRPLRALAARCAGAPWSSELAAIESELDVVAEFPLDEIPARLDRLVARLGALPRVRPFEPDNAIRCDAASGIQLQLPPALFTDLERLLPRYARFYGAIYPEALTRETFATRFLRRFPPDTAIPVLDLVHGVFEPAAIPALAAFRSAAGTGGTRSTLREAAGRAFERAHGFLVARALEADRRDEEEIQLSDADWDEISGEAPEPAFSCAALVQVAARSIHDIDRGDARVCLNALFPGAGLSVARLAHLHGGDEGPVPALLREGWARRARRGAAFAEVSYMHSGRTANAGLRPSLFELEIELPGDRASTGRGAVPLRDLTATWDSASRRFRIDSISRGIEILPVISSGIDPEGFVSFLTLVGNQGIQPLGYLPGFDDTSVRRWPRIRYGNVVLFRRRRVFDAREMPQGKTAAEHFLAIQRWKRRERLPRRSFVHTDAAPKPFYVDFESPGFVDLLRRTLAGGGARVHVTEMLPGPDEMWVRDEGGRYASELLVHCDNLAPSGDAALSRPGR